MMQFWNYGMFRSSTEEEEEKKSKTPEIVEQKLKNGKPMPLDINESDCTNSDSLTLILL